MINFLEGEFSMFANAIELVRNYTRPVKTITRNYKDTNVVRGAATMFFVNDEGCAITCRHVVEQLLCFETINQNYSNFKTECEQLPNDNKRKAAIKKLEQKYKLKSTAVAQMKPQFPYCFDTFSNVEYKLHPQYDIAILEFKGFNSKYYVGHAVFAKNINSIRHGDSLCRLGFPFPEFNDFLYDPIKDDIFWDSTKSADTPFFPIDGMFTRQLVDPAGRIYGIEISTPGLKGQSGGPLFNSNGLVYGIQSMTHHLHLGFDIVKEKMIINGKEVVINNQPFLHVGQCINVDIIKEFLDQNKIKYYVGDDPSNEELVNG